MKEKKYFISKIGFMKWGKLSPEAIDRAQLPGEKYKEIWVSPDVRSLWVVYDDGFGIGYNKVDYDGMQDHDSPLETIQVSLEESYEYKEGDTGNIMTFIEGYEYKKGDEIVINLDELKSWHSI